MQERGYDYFHHRIPGCCLNCTKEEKGPGCLCFDCKCTKCIWYNADKMNGSACDMKLILKTGNEWAYNVNSLIRLKLLKKLERKNEERSFAIKQKKGIECIYSCQNCKTNFVTFESEELPITQGVFPLCDICSGDITLTEDERHNIEEEISFNLYTKFKQQERNKQNFEEYNERRRKE